MRRPSAALVVALLALVVSLLGSGVAAVAGGKYLITASKQVKPGAIKTSNLSKKTVAGLRGQRGAPGAPGSVGAVGPTGPRGPGEAWLIRGTEEGRGVTVPAGSYVITGTVYVGQSSAASCRVYRRSIATGVEAGTTFFGPPGGVVATIAVGTSVTLTGPTLVFVGCAGTGANVLPLVTVLAVTDLVQGPA